MGAFIDLLQDLRRHVASCTSTVTTNNGDDSSDDSSLTPPPDSPSVLAFNNAITVDASKLAPRIKSIEVNGDSPANGIATNGGASTLIRAYVNPKTEFAYYDKVDDREASVATRRNSEEPEDSKSSADPAAEVPSEDKAEVKPRYPFSKFTSLEIFDDYLGSHEDMDYDELYLRTSKVAEILLEYQNEWDQIGKEIDDHEAYVKAQSKIAADKSKASEEEKTKVDDQRYLQIAQDYRAELKLSRSDWDKWLEEQQALYPDQSELQDCLRNLRNPTFLMGIHKRQKVSAADTLKLANKPLLQDRVTKEEVAMEKRKRYGRLLDQTTFDDMKHADAYGFNYSSQPHHVGNQPQPSLNEKAKSRGAISDEGRGGRSQRTVTKRSYDADKSVTPETDEEELPAKRARKARNLDAGLDFQPRPRNAPQSRGATPAVRVFPSGKRVGRPPTKSKLKEVQHPPPSESPSLENGTAPRKLAPKQEELLHESVENLVNQTQPRRPRASAAGLDDSTKSTTPATSRPSTSSSHEPRKRKIESNNTEPDTLVVEGPSTMSPLPPPVAKSRKRKVKEEEVDESLLDPEALEALRKKRIKSQKLSESLRKRWEKGEMATAMESRKATNAKKKAAKIEAKLAMEQQNPAYPPPGHHMSMPPAIIPNYPMPTPHAHPHPPVQQQYQLQSQVPPPPPPILPQPETPISTPPSAPRGKQSSAKRNSAKGKKAAPPPAQPAPAVVPARGPSKRTRRPTRLALDGQAFGGPSYSSDDEEEEAEAQLKRESKKSEYDYFQSISSPKEGEQQVVLGKRQRKQKMDLKKFMSEGEDDDYSSN